MTLKRKRPDQSVGETDPTKEHIWVKWPGEEMKDVTYKSWSSGCFIDEYKVSDEYCQHHGKSYRELHTHPDASRLSDIERKKYLWGEIKASILPSPDELLRFSTDPQIKKMVIVQRDVKTGERLGRIFIKKPKNYSPVKLERGMELNEIYRDNGIAAGETGYTSDFRKAFEETVKAYGLRYRFVPAKGYEVKNGSIAFTKKTNLESKVAAAIFILALISSLVFLSSNITGFAILNISKTNSNIAGIALLLISLLTLLLLKYYRKQK